METIVVLIQEGCMNALTPPKLIRNLLPNFCLLIFCLLSGNAFADDWLGNTSNWFTPGNWSTGAVPDSNTDAVVDSGGANPIITTPGATANNFFLGETNTNTFNVNSGGAFATNTTYIGYNSSATGTAFVSGPNAVWTNNGAMNVGYGGTATLSITAGGIINTGTAAMATQANSTSTVTLDGTGTAWNINSSLFVAQGGTATLLMSDHSLVSDSDGYVGYNPGSSGFAILDNSTWNNSNNLTIGTSNGSSGFLQMSDGAVVSDLNGIIARAAGSQGTVTVDGAGTTWNNGNSLVIGNGGGVGSLTLSNASVVNVGGSSSVNIGAGSVLNIGAVDGSVAVAAGTINAATMHLNGDGQVVFNQTDTLYFFNPSISGTGSLLLEGTGITVLNGVNTYSGGTTVSAGTLQGSSASLNGLITNNSHVIFDQTFSGNFNGTITGTGDLVKNGVGTTIFSQANTYAGVTHINAGVLQIAADDNLGSNTDVHFNIDPDNPDASRTLATSQSFTLLHNLFLDSDGTLAPLAGTTLTLNTISGPGNLIKSGAGTLLIDTPVASTGNTIIQQGTLLAGVPDILNASPQVQIANQGVFNLGGLPQTVNNLQNNGTLAVSAFQSGRTTFNSLMVTNNFTGNGQVLLSTDLLHQRGDFITVAGTVAGTQRVIVANDSQGADPAPGTVLKLVQTGGGSGNFTGATDAGTFRYEILRGNGSLLTPDINSFYLEQILNDLTNTANAAIGLYSAQIAGFYADMQTLMQRMGELRLMPQSGYWIKPYAQHITYNNQVSRTFDQTSGGADAGIDYGVNSFHGGHLSVGLFGGYLYSGDNFHHNANGTLQQFSLGVYATWLHPRGWYTDVTAKYAQQWNSFYAVTGDGVGSSANYSVPAVGGSIEVGRRQEFKVRGQNYFIEPQLQIATAYIAGMNYAASNGLQINGGYQTSFAGRAGARAGMHFDLPRHKIVEPYVQASIVEEIAGANNISTNSSHFTTRLPPTVGRIGTGLTWQLAQSAYVYGEYDYAFGRSYHEPVALSAGARWVW
jgi:outer membrane autotransporter protein